MSVNKMDSAALYHEHNKAVTTANKKLHDAGALVDVTVTVGDVAFPCHKSLLAAWSGFFRSMFSSDFTENHSSQVTLAETSLLSSEAFVVLHTWMYHGELNLTLESVELVLPSAFYLQMDKTVDMLTDYIKVQYSGHVPVTRMFRHLNLAHSCGMPHLRDMALTGMTRNFDNLVEVEELLELNPEDMLRLLGMDRLNAKNEDVVFNAAFAWLHHNEDRLDYLRDVLKSLRVGLVSVGMIRNALDVEIMSKDSECCGILLDALAAGESHKESFQQLQQTFPGMYVKRTGPVTDGSKRDVATNPFTLYGDIWRDAYANLGDSRPDMSDVTLTVDGQDFRCHKAVLFGWSEYFSRRFVVDEGSADGVDCPLGDAPTSDHDDYVQPGDQPSPHIGALISPSRDTLNADQDDRPAATVRRSTTDETSTRRLGEEGATPDPDRSVAPNAVPEISPHRGPGGAMVGQWRDSSSRISLTGDCVTKNTVSVLLDWIYRGQLKVTFNNLCDVMKCARCLQMDRVVEVVAKYFNSYWPTLVGGEIIIMLHAAKKCDLADVHETCFNQVVGNFEAVWVSPEFKDLLDVVTLLRILQDDRLKPTTEDVVLQAALSWLRRSESRLDHIGDVIKSVRLGLVERATLIDGLNLAFLSRNAEIHTMLQLAIVKEPWSKDSLQKDHPYMYRRRQRNKSFYDLLGVTSQFGSTDECDGRLERARGVCVLGELTLVADHGRDRLVAFIPSKVTNALQYLCHVQVGSPDFCVTDADRATVYVCSGENDAITMVKWTESQGLHVVGRLTAGGKLRDPRHMAMAPGDKEHVYVACEDGVHKVSVTTDTVVTTLGRPAGVTERPMRLALVGSVGMVQHGGEKLTFTFMFSGDTVIEKPIPGTLVFYPEVSSPGRVFKPGGIRLPSCGSADGVNFLVGDFQDGCVYVVTPSGETLTKVNTGGVKAFNISMYGDNMYVVPYIADGNVYVLS